jgi:hypothetical protein
MSRQERVYRMLLVAYPRRHRDVYGEPMVQAMRDRVRDEGGGLGSVLLWGRLLADLVGSALSERREATMGTLATGWWRVAACLIGAVLAWAAIDSLFAPATGPWYQYVLGPMALGAAPILITAGLVVRERHRRQGSLMVATGVIPGIAAVVLFWWPPFLLFGLSSIAVFVAAINDAEAARRHGSAPAVLEETP